MDKKLRNILPKYYEYKIVTFEKNKSDNFDAVFKVNLFDEIAVKNWLKQFEQCSLTNFRVARTAPAKQTRVLFKKYYRCHHNTRASETASKTKKAHVKHTGCEATLLITVNNSCMKSCKQPDVKHFPCTVKYHNFHNHPLTSDELLCHRKPSERIEQKIRDLLLKNHTPVSALKILKQDLQQEFKDEYAKIIKDGAFCPKLQWVYHKYYSIFKEMCTDPFKLKYSLTDYMIEECDDTDSEPDTSNDIVSTLQTPSPLRRNSRIASNEDNDITYEEYILSSEDKSLFDNHFVEVYTVDESDINSDKESIFIPEENIVDLPMMGEEMVDSYDELSIMGNVTSKSDYSNLTVDKEIIVTSIETDPLEDDSSSGLWNDDIKQKVVELNEQDLSDIFGDNDIKLNSEIFLNDELRTYEKDKT